MQNIVFFFNETWICKYLFTEVRGKAACVGGESILLCLRFTKHLQIQAHD